MTNFEKWKNELTVEKLFMHLKTFGCCNNKDCLANKECHKNPGKSCKTVFNIWAEKCAD